MAVSRGFAKFGELRTSLEGASEDRLLDAYSLRDARRWASAVAMGIYSLEIRIKVLICLHLDLEQLPRAVQFHELQDLLVLTGLSNRIKREAGEVLAAWERIVRLSKQATDLRYSPGAEYSEAMATEFFDDLQDPVKGVLPWLSLAR